MEIYDIGQGNPRLGVISLIHGEEPSGKYAIERLLETYEISAFNKPVRLVIANERAYNESKRYIDEDLQRAELVDSPANHEQKLAKEIARAFEEVELVLSLHSTESDSDDFIVIPELTVEGLQTVKDMQYEVVERRREDNIWVLKFTIETDFIKGFGRMELSQDSAYIFDGKIDHIEWIVTEEQVYPILHTSEGQAFPYTKYENF